MSPAEGGRLLETRYVEQYRRLQKLMSGVTYKKDWKINLELSSYQPGIAVIRVVMPVEDTYRPGVMTEVVSMQTLSLSYDFPDEQFYTAVLECLKYVEEHECREWFKVDGKIFSNPHAPRHAMTITPNEP